MKKIITYVILLLMVGFSTSFAQATRPVTTEKAETTGSVDDPKISAEQQALLLAAGENNPAKIDEKTMIDPKINPEDMASEDDYGDSNAKPGEESGIDPKLESGQIPDNQKASKKAVGQATVNNQPAGESGGTIPDYRNMVGSNTQPDGEAPDNIQDYRNIRGSASQPDGDMPIK